MTRAASELRNPAEVVGYDDNGDPQSLGMISDAAKVADQTIPAGARIPNSTVDSYESTKEDWKYAVVDLSANTTTVYDGPAIIGNVWVNAVMSAHVCPIKDTSTTVVEIPASSAAGYSQTHQKGTRFETSLIVDPDDAATGTIVVQWSKL